MKVLILLFFTFTVPLVLFFTALLYGGITPELLKTQLTEAYAYEKLTDKIKTLVDEDTDNQQLASIITSRFTSSYLQEKTEGVIDDASLWITGKSTTPPSVSFKEIKTDILEQNPELLTTIEEMSDEMRKQPSMQEDVYTDETPIQSSEEESTQQMAETAQMLSSLAKSDFSIDMTKYLVGIKNLYTTIRIAQPVLAVLLLLSLLLLLLLNKTWSSRLFWSGETLLVSSIWGFGIIALNSILFTMLSNFLLSNTNEYVTIFSPLALTSLTFFATTYVTYQKITSIVFLILAALCFVGGVLIKRKTQSFQFAKPTKKK